jgi:exonuclease SbcC
MKILVIRIRNLASLEGTTEIDFTQEPLCSAGIFAITGPTGAGKSTILDALCLALYARTPRYDKSSDPNQSIQDISGNTITQSDPRKILRDGAAEGYAEVDFMGVDGHRHCAQWSVRRARNKAEGALQAYQVTCKNLDTQADVQGTKTEVLSAISRLIGLSFEQFTRAVLLAQGDFTAFLKAPTSEKSELLEKLTGTEIYTQISKRVFERHREEKEELTILHVQQEGISVLNEEELAVLNNRITELTTLLQQQQQHEEALAKELAWHEKLHTLQNTLSASNLALESATAQKTAAAPREQKLAQVEQVQAVRSPVEGLKTQQQLLTNKETKYKALEAELLQLQEQQKQQNEALTRSKQTFETHVKAQEQAQPLLNKAKQLDVQLTDRIRQQHDAEAELTKAQTAHTKHNEHIATLKQQAQQLQQTIEQLTEYTTRHQSRKPLAENEKLVVSTLADARTVLQEAQQAQENITALQQLLNTKQAEEKTQTETLARLTETEQELAAAFAKLQAAVSAIDITSIQQNKAEVETQVLELVQAAADWKTLFDATTQYEKDQLTLTQNKKELDKTRQQLADTTKALETAQTLKDAASRSLEMARMETAESVVILREQLTEQQPCPVCGSTEHPYATHDPRIDNILARLEADFKQQEATWQQALTTRTTLHEKIRQLETATDRLAGEQLLQERELKAYRESWARFSQHSEADNHAPAEIAGWLTQQLTRKKQEQQQLQKQTEEAQQQQRELEAHKKRHEEATTQYREADNRLKDLRRDIASQHEKLEQAQKEHARAVQKLTQTETSLSIYFTATDWFDNWKADADTFTQRIAQFAAEWKSNTETLDNTTRQQQLLAATLKGDEEKLQLLTADLSKKQEAATSITQQYQALLSERKGLFEGRATDTVEQQLKAAIDQAQQTLDRHKAQQELTQHHITRSATQRDETQQEMQRLRTAISELERHITQWLEAYNTHHTPPLARNGLEELLTLPAAWMETERKALQQVKDALLQAETVLKENQKALEQHRQQQASANTMETVAQSLAAARTTRQDTQREDTETKLRIRQDADNRQKAGALLQQIAAKEKTVHHWAMLNQVIGSADGKKFRQVAQEYTLDVLLGYTNVQLAMLSRRYVLQRIPQSLGLQVADGDMGNEVRTVNSLSGGESFLVSLALALGLASLSSSRMQVESLFIDEGFGSLDPDTLNIAMDALERLHNQGRKVGVISHVQEMTERIPVQISVSKQNGGKSKVNIKAA